MQSLSDLTSVQLENSWVTIGSFDGVHLGHQALINELVKTAHAHGESAVVITLYPHPLVVLRNIPMPYYLTTPDEKKTLMAEMGVDALLTLNFNQHLANLSAKEFVTLLKDHLGMKELWIGEGFALGKNRQGNVDTLGELGKELGFEVKVNELMQVGTYTISSSQIRQALILGQVDKVTEMLGRLYRVTGKVVHGEGRGKGLGYPTANIDYDPVKLIPANGIYATWSWWKRKRFPSVTNIGLRPTFNMVGLKPTIEPFFVDFDQDLYNEILTLEFLKYLRPEEKFTSVEELKRKIQQDVEEANEVFSHAPRTPGLST
jgi:riboflavin kinase / FMN adenylyltransferase